MGMANRPAPTIVSIAESTTAAGKVSLGTKFAIQMRRDGNNDPPFQGSPGLCNIACSEELPPPIHYPNKRAYPGYGSLPAISSNWITLKSG